MESKSCPPPNYRLHATFIYKYSNNFSQLTQVQTVADMMIKFGQAETNSWDLLKPELLTWNLLSLSATKTVTVKWLNLMPVSNF